MIKLSQLRECPSETIRVSIHRCLRYSIYHKALLSTYSVLRRDYVLNLRICVGFITWSFLSHSSQKRDLHQVNNIWRAMLLLLLLVVYYVSRDIHQIQDDAFRSVVFDQDTQLTVAFPGYVIAHTVYMVCYILILLIFDTVVRLLLSSRVTQSTAPEWSPSA